MLIIFHFFLFIGIICANGVPFSITPTKSSLIKNGIFPLPKNLSLSIIPEDVVKGKSYLFNGCIINALYPFGVAFCSNSKIKSSHNLLISFLSFKDEDEILENNCCLTFYDDSELNKIMELKSNFDFKLLDFEADRYVIDYLNINLGDQYFLFPQINIKNRLVSSTASQY